MPIKRRDFLKTAGGSIATTSLLAELASAKTQSSEAANAKTPLQQDALRRPFNSSYEGAYLNRVSFPMGGIGAGMICLEGSGALTNVSLRNQPHLKNEPLVFGAIAFKGKPQLARVLEGPVPAWKHWLGGSMMSGGVSSHGGYPRFREASFRARFPFGQLSLSDERVPLNVEITGWSPFEPGDADNASLPVAGLEYTFTNSSAEAVDAVFSFHAQNFLAGADMFTRAKKSPLNGIRSTPGGYVLSGTSDPEDPWDAGALAISVEDRDTRVNHAWPSSDGGIAWTLMSILWSEIARGESYDRPPLSDGTSAPGASLFVPVKLAPGASKTIRVRLAWYVPGSRVRTGDVPGSDIKGKETYRPWYSSRFGSIDEINSYWTAHYAELKEKTERFTQTFYESTLPPEVLEAIAANLAILKTPTVLRQSDGRFWGWEGCLDTEGFCPGSCTHVWSFAQAVPHLFPSLERTLRETELRVSQGADGYQTFRALIPIRPPDPATYILAAADGQLGGIIKTYREWRISGDTEWVRGLWPYLRASLDYCIRSWDTERKGYLDEPQHVGFDVWLWGPNGMTTSLYVGALKAAVLIGQALKTETSDYEALLKKAVQHIETQLFNGEYFFQQTEWRTLKAKLSGYAESVGMFSGVSSWVGSEFLDLAEKEGPQQQYGNGCLANGINGAWLAWACGLGDIINVDKVKSHLRSVHRHNFKHDLTDVFNPCRSAFACNTEGGVLICSFPNGERPTVPLMYSSETWTGIEYEIASHLIARGMVEEGLEVVRAIRARHDGQTRNPFDEMEAGHFYARAMASYALLQSLSGARYDAVDRVLHLAPTIPGDFKCFLSTATGYGLVGVEQGKPFVKVVSGKIPYKKISYRPTGDKDGNRPVSNAV